MKTPKARYDKDQEVYFSEEVVELIKNSKAIKRTGYAEWMNSGATPRYFEYLKGMPCLEIFSNVDISYAERVVGTINESLVIA